MCIRDRWQLTQEALTEAGLPPAAVQLVETTDREAVGRLIPCLLYTSDAAGERSRGDLGGRPIIKKKTHHPPPTRATIAQLHQTCRR